MEMDRNETYMVLCTPTSIYVKFANIKSVQSTKILSLTSDLNSIVSFKTYKNNYKKMHKLGKRFFDTQNRKRID